ncbi:MAG: hypothetical protein GX352_04485, partial [Clostridiales bacterium]|nr:hypothetical protein [Clostridiales bacterium]
EEIAGLTAAASGVEERIEGYKSRIKEYGDKKQFLARTIRETNSEWGENHIQFIQSINTDGIEHGSLATLVERHRETSQSLKSHLDARDVLAKEYEELRGSHENIGKSSLLSGLKKYLYIFIISALLGGILSIFIPTLGILIGAGGIGGAILYTVLNFLDSKESKDIISQRDNLIKTKAARILEEDKAIKELKSDLESLEEKLDGYRKVFGLSDGVYYSVLPNHLLRIRNIQEKVDELQRMENEMTEIGERIDSDLLRYRTFISQLDGDPIDVNPAWGNDRKEGWKEILSRLKLWGELLKQSEALEVLEQKREAVREEMMEIMGEVDLDNKDFDLLVAKFIDRSEKAIEYKNKQNALIDIQRALLNSMASDRIRGAFGMIPAKEGDSSRNEEILALFEEQCGVYTSTWEAEEAYREVSGYHNKKLSERDSLKEKIQRLKIEIQQLASPEDLARGQRQIDAGRARLEALAKDYAVNKIASFLLKETEKNLLEGMKDSIMGSAGTIFRNMTGGEYEGILPSEPILDSDFQAVMGEGTDSQTIEMLSRGTREQLYLSVRLSRIMDIKPCLPIIIDDSFANFDSAHLMQSIKILSELSKTHQIFILTCHSQLVDGINKCGCESQYWLLDGGKLSISDHEELTHHLCRGGL